jgi:hypothetical protein
VCLSIGHGVWGPTSDSRSSNIYAIGGASLGVTLSLWVPGSACGTVRTFELDLRESPKICKSASDNDWELLNLEFVLCNMKMTMSTTVKQEEHLETLASPKQSKKRFFGVPIVGFFGQRKRLIEKHEHHHGEEAQPMLSGDTELVHHYTDQADATYVSATPAAPVSAPSVRSADAPAAATSVRFNIPVKPKRSGKELWDILRHHVQQESFHISDNWRLVSNKTERPDVYFDQVTELPYDFTLKDCVIALLVFLAISVIAFSFVFEKWTVIDSMYFAVVTFTTTG